MNNIDLSIGIVAWMQFTPNRRCLCVNSTDAVARYLTEQGLTVDEMTIEAFAESSSVTCKKYDYILALEVLEYSKNPIDMIERLISCLSSDGALYLGTDNRFGVRYFCGDKDVHTGHTFDGIEGYSGYNKRSEYFKGRAYLKSELEEMLHAAGCHAYKFYSVLPNLEAPQLIYAEDYLPEEQLATRYIPMYRDPSGIFIREELLYDGLIQNGMFHLMANSYLIEYRADGKKSNVQHVTLSMDRGEENACATVIYHDKAEKRAISKPGQLRLQAVIENDEYLRNHGIKLVSSELIDGIYTMPRIKAESMITRFRDLLENNVDGFVKELDRYHDMLCTSSKIVRIDEDLGPILERCYIDMVPLNCFWKDDDYLFFDQEFYLENEPVNLIVFRTIVIIYNEDPTRYAILPREVLWDRYGITDHLQEYIQKSEEFLANLRNKKTLETFNHSHVRSIEQVGKNRRKVEKVLTDWQNQIKLNKECCFDDIGGRELYVWGSGRYADEFVCMYRYDYRISGIIDNDPMKAGQDFYGYPIYNADCLTGKDSESYKVIVCVRNCEDILKQLFDIGTRYVGVYDIHYTYPGRQKYLPGQGGLAAYQDFAYSVMPGFGNTEVTNVENDESVKPYRIGYIAGVFDLYHLGHLNMFRRAKELCEYLIVGVVSDEGVRINKNKEPFVPFDERIEMVRSCRYVDEAVEIPFVYCRTPEAFRKYHFDVQFSGSDYENDPGWLAMKDYLEQRGSTMVFFSYTEQTSSTKIKELIDKGLM